jgi:hypothetical protein
MGKRRIINSADSDPVQTNDRLLQALQNTEQNQRKSIVQSSTGAAGTLNEGSVGQYNLPIAEQFAGEGLGALEELKAENQGAGEKWANGIGKFFGKTGTAVLGGTLGSIYGIGSAINNGDFNNFYDNDFQHMLDNWNEHMDTNLPNYYTQKEQENNILQSLGTANFWANDVLGGLSFTAGAILTELVASAATVATFGAATPLLLATTAKNVAQAAKLMKKLSRTNKSKDILNKAATFSRQLVTGSFYEAGVEARHFKESAKDEFLKALGKTEQDLTIEEKAQIDDKINTMANGVFAANSALVSFSNFVTLGKTFGMGLKQQNVGKALKTENLTANQFKNVGKEIAEANSFVSAYKTYSKTQNALNATAAFLKPLVTEGLVEEGGQSLIQNTSLNYIAKKYSKEGNDNTYSLFESMGDSFGETYGTKEGWKEIGIGMIIGALGFPNINYKKGSKDSIWSGGSYGSLQDYKETKQNTDSLVDFMNNNNVAESTKALWEGTVRQHEAIKDMENSNGNMFQMKNAEDDVFFSFVSSRIKGGYYSDISEELVSSINELSPEEFGKAFGYKDLTKEELESRKKEVVDKTLKQAEIVKEAMTQASNIDQTNDKDVELGLAHTIYSIQQTKARKDNLINEISNKIGDIDGRELGEIAKANRKIKFKKNWLKTYNKELNKLRKAKEKLEKDFNIERVNNETLEEANKRYNDHALSLKGENEKINAQIKKIKQYEKELNEAIKKEKETRKGDLTGTLTEIKDTLLKNVEIREKIENHYEQNPLDKQNVEEVFNDILDLENREQTYVGQYNILSQSKKAQETFKSELTKVRDFLMSTYGKKGKAIQGQEEVDTNITEGKDIAEESFLNEDTINDTFNQFKDRVKAEIDNTNLYDNKIGMLESRKDILNKYIKEAEAQIKLGTEIDDYYQMFIDNSKKEITKINEQLKVIKAEEARIANLPKGMIVHRPEEYTQMFINFDNADSGWLGIDEKEVRGGISLKVVDYEGEEIETKGNNGLTTIMPGISLGNNKGKAVQIIYKGKVIGALKDPNRFVLTSTKEPLNIAGNINHLEMLNPSFVNNGKVTPEGQRMRDLHKNLRDIWVDIYGGKTEFTNEELQKVFWINKTNSVKRTGASKPTLKDYFDSNPEYKLEYTYTNAESKVVARTGFIIVEQGVVPKYFLRNDNGIEEITEQEEIDRVQDIVKETLDRSPNLEMGMLGNNFVLADNLATAVILDTRSPIDTSSMEEVDDKGSMFTSIIDALNSLTGDIDFEGKKAKVKVVAGSKKSGNFISLLNASGINATINVVRFKKSDKPVLKLNFSYGNKDTSINLDYKIVDGKLQVKSFGKYKKLTWKLLQDITNNRFSDKNKKRDEYVPTNLHDVKLGNLLQRVIPEGDDSNIQDYDNLQLNYIVDAGLHFVPKVKKQNNNNNGNTGTKGKKSFYESFTAYINKASLPALKGIKFNILNNKPLIVSDPSKTLTKDQKKAILDIIEQRLNPKKEVKPKKESKEEIASAAEFLGALKPKKETKETKESVEPVEAESNEIDLNQIKQEINSLNQLYNLVRRKGDNQEVYEQYKEKFAGRVSELPEKWENIIPLMTSLKDKLPKNDKPTFSISDKPATKLIDLTLAKENLRRMLPDSISLKDINLILQNIQNKGITWGAFSNSIVYLNSKAEEGTEYHEAFHAVFRTLLTDTQINRYYRHARSKWGKPKQSDLNKLRNSSSAYLNYTDSQLENLWYEEKLADEFKNYGVKRQSESWLRKLYKQIKNLFNWITGSKNELDLLFSDIYEGKFKYKESQYNVFRNSNPVFSLMKFETFGNDSVSGFFNTTVSNRIINTIARNVIKNNSTIEQEIDNMAERYNVENWEEELNAVEEKDFDKMLEIEDQLNQRYTALEFNPIEENPNHPIIKKAVEQRIKLYNTEELEEFLLDEESEDKVSFDKSPAEIGGFTSMSKQMKQYIGFTPLYIDEFGFKDFIDLDYTNPKYELSSDGIKIYNGLSRLLVNTKKSDMLKKAFHFSENNENAANWVDVLFEDIKSDLNLNIPNEELINLSFDELSESNFFNMFVSTFYKTDMKYMTILFNPHNGKMKTFNANQKDVKQQQFDEWKKQYRANNITQELANTILTDINKKLNSFKSVLELQANIKDIQALFNKLGINLSDGYIKYSIIEKHLEAIEQKLTDENLNNTNFDYFNSLLDYHASFNDVETINAEVMTALLTANKNSKGNEFGMFVELDGDSTTGAIGRLLKVADNNSVFDESVGKSTFQNAENKTIYSHIAPTYYTEESRKWRDRKHIISAIKEDNLDKALSLLKQEGYDDYNAKMLLQVLENNPLILESEDLINATFDNMRTYMLDGVRVTNLNSEGKELAYGSVQESAKAFKRLDQRGKALLNLMLFADSSSTLNKANDKETRLFNVGVNAEKSTNYLVQLPTHHFVTYKGDNIELTDKGYDWYLKLFKQEYERIQKVKDEIDNNEKEKFNNYNTGQENGTRFYHFTNINNADRFRDLALKGESFENIIDEVKSELDNFVNEQFQDYINVLSGSNVSIIEENYDKNVTENSYEGNITPEKDTIFVFGSNPEGRHGAGAAKVAKDKFGAKYGKGEGLQGNAYALPTKDLRVKENKGLRSISSETITNSIKELYKVAKNNPNKKFKIAYRNTDKASLNGYTGLEMIDMFNAAGNIPSNVYFSSEWINTGKLNVSKNINEEIEFTGYSNKLLPDSYLDDNGKVDMSMLANFFFNDYLNTYAFTSLLDGDYAMNYKMKDGKPDFTDPIKRNSGKVAAGSDMGEGKTKVAIIKSINKNISGEHGVTGRADSTDAQTYGTMKWYKKYLKATGKYNKQVKRIVKKLQRGIPISDAEYSILDRYNADIRPRKIVQRDMTSYIKTSLHTLTRNLTSVNTTSIANINKLWDQYEALVEDNKLDEANEKLKYIQTFWKPLPGREELHDLLNKMETEDIGLVTFDSSVKTARRNVGTFENGQWNLTPYDINDNTIREQVSTDNNKSKIVDGTQKMQLIWSEQDRNSTITFRGETIKLGDVVDAYQKFLGERVRKGTEKMRNTLKNGSEANYKELHKSIKASLDASGTDPYLQELFTLDENGTPNYNWNFPAIEKKFQAMYLSYVSKDSLKQKAPGRKYTLVSDYGMNVMRDKKGKIVRADQYKKDTDMVVTTSRLKHRVLDTDGQYYSEVMLPKSAMNLMGLKIGDKIPDHLAKQFGIRIPTQDKHSMVNMKVVDYLPNEYSNVIIMPYEIVLLSGADFDIDSLFVRVFDNYRDYDSDNKSFGSYINEKNEHQMFQAAFEEFVIDQQKNNDKFKEQVNEIVDNDRIKIIADNKRTIEEIEELLDKNKEKSKELSELLDISKYLLTTSVLTEMGGKFNLEYVKDNLQYAEYRKNVRDFRELKNESKKLSLLKSKGRDIIKQLRHENLFLAQQATLNILNYPSTLEDFKKSNVGKKALANFNAKNPLEIQPITKGELNNLLLELEFPLLHNDANKGIAATPATMDVFSDLLAKLERLGIAAADSAMDIHSAGSKSKASSSIDIGAEGIGPVALFNVIFQQLNKNNIKISDNVNEEGERLFNPLFGQYESFTNTKQGAEIVNLDGQRINDLLSSVLSAMTDNAKEQFAAKFNLSIDTLSPALVMISMGIPFDTVMLFMKQPIMSETMDLLTKSKSSVKTKTEQKELTRGDESVGKIIDRALTLVTKGEEFETVEMELSEDNFTKALQGKLPDNELYSLQQKVGEEFHKAKEYATYLRNLSKLFSLIKGLDATWSNNELINESLEELGIEIKGTTFKNIKITQVKENTPFNVLDVINNSELISNNLKAYHLIQQDSERFFISQTKPFKDIRNILEKNLKTNTLKFENNKKSFYEHLLGYLTVKAYRNKNNPDINIDNFFSPKIIEKINALLQEEEFENNTLLKFLKQEVTDYTNKPNHIFGGNILYKVTGNTRTKSDPDYVESLMSSYKQLFMSNVGVANTLAKDLFMYILTKDNFNFKNNSIIRQISPYFLKTAMSSLGDAHQTFINDNNYEDTFGVSKAELIEEFTDLYYTYSDNSFLLKGNKKDAVLKGVKKTEGKRKDDRYNYPIFIKDGQLTINMFAGGSKNLKDNLDHISKGSTNTKLFEVNKSDGKILINFPKYVKIDNAIYKLQSYKNDSFEDKVAKNINNGVEALYTEVNQVGTREILPYAFTVEEWNSFILNNSAKNTAIEDEIAKGVEEAENEENQFDEGVKGEVVGADSFMKGLDKSKKKSTKNKKDDIVSADDFMSVFNKKQNLSVMDRIPIENANVILNALKLKFGIDWVFDESIDALGLWNPNTNKIHINPNKMTIETLFHEFAHPFIEVVKIQNPSLYKRLEREVKRIGINEELRPLYEQEYKDAGLNTEQIEDALITESIVTVLGLYASGETLGNGLTRTIDRFLKFIKEMINNILNKKVLTVDQLPADTNLRDLAKILTDNSIVNLTSLNSPVKQLQFKKGNCK